MRIDLLNDESRESALSEISARFEDYYADREDYDEVDELNNAMYVGATSRGKFDAQERRWIPLHTDFKSNVGSVLFHRQVNTRAGMLGAMIASGRPLWKYLDRYVEGLSLASETASFESGVMNAWAKWCLEQDGWREKAPEFCTDVYKRSNVLVMVGMKEQEKDGWIAEDVQVGETVDPNTGFPVPLMGKKLKKKKGMAYGYPSFSFPDPRNVYVDKNIADIQEQGTVIVLSLTSKAKLAAQGKVLDQEAVAALEPEDEWDGQFASESLESQREALHRDTAVREPKGVYLQWDVWHICPLNKGGEWVDEENDEEIEWKRLYFTLVGNGPGKLKVLKVTDQFHPEGEIPLKPIRAIPTNGTEFYHPTHGEVVRSVYTAFCAIRNATIDNLGIRTRPPVLINMNQMGLLKDLTWKPDAKWFLNDITAVAKWEPPEITQQSQILIDQLQEETKLALATDPARLGEYAGARTSKYEVQRVTGSTDTTIALQNAYVVGQLLPWMARQLLLYTQAFVDAAVIRRVVNAHLPQPIEGENIGEYDVEVDIVGEYMDEMEKAAQATEAMQVLSLPTNAQLVPPSTRLALIKQFLEARKFDVSRLDFEGAFKDSEANAIARINQMLVMGVFIPPEEGENVDVHLRVAKAQRMKWQGLEQSDPRGGNVPLIDQYIQALMQLKEQQQQQMAMMEQGMQQQGNVDPAMQGGEMGGMF